MLIDEFQYSSAVTLTPTIKLNKFMSGIGLTLSQDPTTRYISDIARVAYLIARKSMNRLPLMFPKNKTDFSRRQDQPASQARQPCEGFSRRLHDPLRLS
jgi:hypothetical protein